MDDTIAALRAQLDNANKMFETMLAKMSDPDALEEMLAKTKKTKVKLRRSPRNKRTPIQGTPEAAEEAEGPELRRKRLSFGKRKAEKSQKREQATPKIRRIRKLLGRKM